MRVEHLSKYKAKPVVVDDIRFHSQAEAKRYGQLKLLFRAGTIRNLELQPAFHISINGKKIFTYKADFAYFEGAERIVEDVKGFRTPVYKLKKKIVEAQLGVKIREVAA
jgi:hypothetical protein